MNVFLKFFNIFPIIINLVSTKQVMNYTMLFLFLKKLFLGVNGDKVPLGHEVLESVGYHGLVDSSDPCKMKKNLVALKIVSKQSVASNKYVKLCYQIIT